MTNTTLKSLIKNRQRILDEISSLKKELSSSEEEILGLAQIQIEDIFGNEPGKKKYGEATFDYDGIRFTIRKRKSVKYDSDTMIEAGKSLSWTELNQFFNVKFDMTETGYKELQAASMDSEKFSDVLSRVDDAREVVISQPQLVSAELTGE